ncbi:MAG: hypothetical protein EA403_12460 [Spirochaetaceae bacterium]|nr:MAG: hypothetical protein EA403_12460 [Spirochaetaceae bacterium]
MQWIFAFVFAVAVINVFVYRWGISYNRRFIVETCRLVERVFQPADTEYTNIGGVVGFNMRYRLEPPLITLEGTLTTAPRHMMFYAPITRLTGRGDSLILSITAEELPAGEAHIVSRAHFEQDRVQLDDVSEMIQTPLPGEEFLVLAFNPWHRDRMVALFQAFDDVSSIVHIGFYGKTDCFSVVLNPAIPSLEATLIRLRSALTDIASPR